MIWFACRQCGKVLSRPDGSGGTFIFCDCGQGQTVPWDSTITAPEAPAETALPAPAAAPVPPALPRLEPIPIDEQRVPRRPPTRSSYDPPPLPRSAWDDRDERRRGRRRWSPPRRDPAFCFNHEDEASVKPCAQCGEGFCSACLVELQGKSLCGPCKNFRVRMLQMPPRVSGMAVTAMIIAMVSGPLALCIWFIAVVMAAPVVNLLSLLPLVFALLLGIASLRDTESNPRVSGRSMAMTAVVTSLVMGTLSVLLALFGSRLGA